MDDLIFDQLTADALKRFIRINSIESINLKAIKRSELASQIKDLVLQNDEHKRQFVSYVRDIESAGRKDFWLMNIPRDVIARLTSELRRKLNGIASESDDIFTPTEIDTPRYFKDITDGNKLKIKAIRKKVLQEMDPTRNRTENGVLLRAYVPKEIRHVSYYEINLSTGLILCGVDVWRTLNHNEKYDLVKRDITTLFGAEFTQQLAKLDIATKAKILIEGENVLTKAMSARTSTVNEQSATFEIKTNRIRQIKKQLNKGELLLTNIKTSNIDTDVKDNTVLRLAEREELPYTTESCKAVLFYKDDISESHDYIRFEIYSDESRVKFLNDHLIRTDLDNVFSKII